MEQGEARLMAKCLRLQANVVCAQDIFRMNQKQLEDAVRRVWSDRGLDTARKAYLAQNIMASKYIVAQQRRALQASHAAPPAPQPNYTGCSHYARRHAMTLLDLCHWTAKQRVKNHWLDSQF